MPLNSPTTYGEWYWSQQVEASKAFDETLEQVYAPLFAAIKDSIPAFAEIPAYLSQFISALAEPPHPGLGAFGAGLAVAQGKDLLDDSLAPARAAIRRKINAGARETWLSASESNTLFQRAKIDKNLWKEVLDSEGYEDVLQGFVLQATQPYPSLNDLITYCRYTGDPENVWSSLQKFYNVDPVDFPVWEWLALQKLSTDQVYSLYKRGFYEIGDADAELARIGWHSVDRPAVLELAYQLPNALLMIQGDLQQEVNDDDILLDVSKCDIHPDYAKKYLDAVLTKPASTDIIAYSLRQNPELEQLPAELRKIGIHPDYFDLYKTLAYPIPPVADLITMAVREAFSPEIAARFGQYEDFPQDFATFAKQKGLSEEWARRYWAAHWSLPSPQQGFEMLHRGIITQEELTVLLRALDVMPYWRDKLIKMAYRPINRIDVRRMYQLGILDRTAVTEAYKQLGYDEDNSKRMTEFVVQQVRLTLSGFNTTDVVNAYKNRYITSSQAMGLLQQIGIKSDEIDYVINTATYQRDWDFRSEQIKAIRNLYKKGQYSETDTRNKLSQINVPYEEIDAFIQQWETQKITEPDSLWTSAQTLSFLKKGIITEARARQEFAALGYNNERIEVYIKSTVKTS